MFKRIAIITATVICCLAPAAASPTDWHMTAASTVHAFRIASGIQITASVELANPCYEAAVHRSPLKILPVQYQVVTRVKPANAHKVCAMVIVPAIAKGDFVVPQVPPTVVVHATNKRFIVPVEISAK
ncbi:MAG TPA: hypothetical protein VFO29_01665 [Candidatus Rubrimentiphilum sp.]|nr:hypothetical protein [Candidatus Rubrimentiphilum sp.]